MTTKKLNPKCFKTDKHGDRAVAFTATGYLLPCCWLDNHANGTVHQKWVKDFYKKEQHIDNHEKIEDIIEGKTWQNFFNMLENDPEDAPKVCWEHCNRPLDNFRGRLVQWGEDID